jgi:hypothetical protein
VADGKCLGDPKKPTLELPDAILFSSIVRENFFNTQACFEQRTETDAAMR